MTPMTLSRIARAMRAGELSPVEHVNDVLERLENDTCNAVVVLDRERAQDAAAQRAAELKRGVWRGPCMASPSGSRT